VSKVFHLTCFQGLSRFYHISVLYSFYWRTTFPLNPFLYSLVNGHVDSFILVIITLLWTFIYTFLCRHMFLFLGINLLNIYLGAELLGISLLCGADKLFPKAIVSFYIPISSVWGLQLLHNSLNTLLSSVFLIAVVLLHVKWYFISCHRVKWWLFLISIIKTNGKSAIDSIGRHLQVYQGVYEQM
jgi:hypothetical protein